MPKVTCTTGNERNGVTPGRSRVTVRTDFDMVVDRFEIPSRMPRMYFKKHPRGEYAKRKNRAEKIAQQLERNYQNGQMPLLVA